MRVARWARLLSVYVTVGFALASCGTGKGDAVRPGNGRALRLGFSDQLRSLNPIYNSGFSGAAIGALAFSYLLRTLPDGRLAPDLALAVPTLANGGISADGRTIVYHLRRGVVWQDGMPLTSADVAFTERAIMNPKNTIGSRDPYDRVAAVETPDAYTVRVRLRAPDAAVPGLFLTPDANAAVIPAHVLARYASLDHVAYNGLPIGSGPYRVVRWDRGSTVRLVSNPAYYAGPPKLAAVELHYFPDTSSEFVQVQTGELDGIIGADRSFVARYRALADRRVSSVPAPAEKALLFNVERPSLGDTRLRRALAQLVDAPSLAKAIYHGAVSARDASRGLFSYADDPHAPWPAYDAAAASRALDALGYVRGASGVRAAGGRELAFTMIFPNSSAATRIAAQTIQQSFARAGVRVDLQSFEYTHVWGLASQGAPLAGGRFDLAIVDYSTNVDPDQSWLLSCAERAPAGYNEARYCSARMDALLRASSLAFDRSRRIAILHDVQRLAATDTPFLPLWQIPEIDVVPKRLSGFIPDGDFPFESARSWAWAP